MPMPRVKSVHLSIIGFLWGPPRHPPATRLEGGGHLSQRSRWILVPAQRVSEGPSDSLRVPPPPRDGPDGDMQQQLYCATASMQTLPPPPRPRPFAAPPSRLGPHSSGPPPLPDTAAPRRALGVARPWPCACLSTRTGRCSSAPRPTPRRPSSTPRRPSWCEVSSPKVSLITLPCKISKVFLLILSEISFITFSSTAAVSLLFFRSLNDIQGGEEGTSHAANTCVTGLLS